MKNIIHQVEFSVFSLGMKSYLILCSMHCQTWFGCCTALNTSPETLGLCSSLWKRRDKSTDAAVCPCQTLTPSLPLSVCPAFSSLSLFRCPAQSFQTSPALLHPVHISQLPHHLIYKPIHSIHVPTGYICWFCSSWILSPCFSLH